MSFPNNLKDLHDMCQQNGIKFKGKTIAQLKDLLASNSVTFAPNNDIDDLSKLSVKALKEKCNDIGNKDKLVKRIESFSCKDDNNMKVIKWKKRGYKAFRNSRK